MALSELRNAAQNLPHEVEVAFDSHLEYYKLFGFRVLAKTATDLVNIFVIGFFALSILFFVSIGGAFMLGEWLGNLGLGFLIIAGFLIILAVVFYLLRKRIIQRPVLRRMSDIYFKED